MQHVTGTTNAGPDARRRLTPAAASPRVVRRMEACA